MTTPFDARNGTTQGRIQPTDGPPFEGNWVFQLGSDVPGVMVKVNDDDGITISQVVGSLPMTNLSFETAGASPGLAADWTVTIEATAQALLDFSDGFPGYNPTPVERNDLAALVYFAFSLDNNFIATTVFSVPYVASLDTDTPPSTFTSMRHGLPDGFEVTFSAPPTGLTASVVYYLVNVTTDTFQVSATLGGSAVAITAGPTTGTMDYQKHGLPDGLAVSLPVPPVGFSATQFYYLVNVTQSTFQLATSAGGSPVTVADSFVGTLVYLLTFKWFFAIGDTTVPGVDGGGFNTGLFALPMEDFSYQWGRHEVGGVSVGANMNASSFLFFLATKLALNFTGTMPKSVVEDFENGWGCDASSFLFALSSITRSGVTFSEQTSAETFGDTLVAGVVISTGLFTVSSCPDNGTPIVFMYPAPGGLAWSPPTPAPGAPPPSQPTTIYYVVKESATTFKVAATLGGSPIILTGANATDVVVDVVGVRAVLPASDLQTFNIGTPSGPQTFESFENVRGTYGPLTVDTSTGTIYAATHTFLDGDEVVLTGPGLPTGSSPPIAEGVVYYAVNVVPTVSLQISATFGGSAIAIPTAAGTGATISGNPAVFFNNVVP